MIARSRRLRPMCFDQRSALGPYNPGRRMEGYLGSDESEGWVSAGQAQGEPLFSSTTLLSMPVSAARLRRWLVAALALVCFVVGSSYLYLRHRVTNALKQVTEKIPIEIQESAHQFTISKSEQGRTIFKLQASKAVQF